MILKSSISIVPDKFTTFVFEGSASVNENATIYPLIILGDTFASHSIIVKSAEPKVDNCCKGQSILLKGWLCICSFG